LLYGVNPGLCGDLLLRAEYFGSNAHFMILFIIIVMIILSIV
jgi:hypothetical protein